LSIERRHRIRHDIRARDPLATGFKGTLGILLAIALVVGVCYAVNEFLEDRKRQQAVALLHDIADKARAERDAQADRDEKARAKREREAEDNRKAKAIEDRSAENRRKHEAKRQEEAELKRLEAQRRNEAERDKRDRRDRKEREAKEAKARAEREAAEEERYKAQAERDRIAAEALRAERERNAKAIAELKRRNAAAWAKLRPRIERDERDLTRMEKNEAKLIDQIKRLRSKLGSRTGPWGTRTQGPFSALISAEGNLRALRAAMTKVSNQLAQKLKLAEEIK